MGVPAVKDVRQRVADFVSEITELAREAEKHLDILDQPNGITAAAIVERISGYSSQMIAIRGTADQLGFERVSRIAGLGEEIAVKAMGIKKRGQLRRLVITLWDALSTVRYMLTHLEGETDVEHEILTTRLQAVLSELGGARATVTDDEIAGLLSSRS